MMAEEYVYEEEEEEEEEVLMLLPQSLEATFRGPHHEPRRLKPTLGRREKAPYRRAYFVVLPPN